MKSNVAVRIAAFVFALVFFVPIASQLLDFSCLSPNTELKYVPKCDTETQRSFGSSLAKVPIMETVIQGGFGNNAIDDRDYCKITGDSALLFIMTVFVLRLWLCARKETAFYKRRYNLLI